MRVAESGPSRSAARVDPTYVLDKIAEPFAHLEIDDLFRADDFEATVPSCEVRLPPSADDEELFDALVGATGELKPRWEDLRISPTPSHLPDAVANLRSSAVRVLPDRAIETIRRKTGRAGDTHLDRNVRTARAARRHRWRRDWRRRMRNCLYVCHG